MLNTSIELIAFNPIVFVSFFCFDKFVPCSTERVVSFAATRTGVTQAPRAAAKETSGKNYNLFERNGVDKSKGTGSGTR